MTIDPYYILIASGNFFSFYRSPLIYSERPFQLAPSNQSVNTKGLMNGVYGCLHVGNRRGPLIHLAVSLVVYISITTSGIFPLLHSSYLLVYFAIEKDGSFTKINKNF